jgi:hypothetical protein
LGLLQIEWVKTSSEITDGPLFKDVSDLSLVKE